MDRSRHQFFAGAAFPVNNNGGTRIGNHADFLVNVQHARTPADQPRKTCLAAKLTFQVSVLADQAAILERAPDLKHYRLAQQLRRTLVTLDRDYLDDRRFPPDEGAGVLVISAPDECQLSALLDRVDEVLFESRAPADAEAQPLPLVGRKLHVHTDWGRGDD